MKSKTILTLAVLAGVSSSQAALINVNYNGGGDAPLESTLSGPAGGLGTTWNSVTTVDTGALNDSTGAPTGVSVDTNYANIGLSTETAGTLPTLRSFLNIFDRPNTNTVTINGLESEGVYDIWLLSFRDIATGGTERSVGTWATTNTTSGSALQSVDSEANTPNGLAFLEGYNFVLFSNVEATAGGVISFTANGNGAGFPQDGSSRRLHLNGLQINQVPEPGSLALLAFGGLLALRRRR